MHRYYCSGVSNERLQHHTVKAYSDKQAWYYFCRRCKDFTVRDFKILKKEEIIREKEIQQDIQLSLNI